ncbi:MAG: hypothetical protein ACTSR7_12575 [Promethearchaeota archaeon]
MKREKKAFQEIMPIFDTILFEIKKQRKKFYFFFSITILVVILVGYILVLIPATSQSFGRYIHRIL